MKTKLSWKHGTRNVGRSNGTAIRNLAGTELYSQTARIHSAIN